MNKTAEEIDVQGEVAEMIKLDEKAKKHRKQKKLAIIIGAIFVALIGLNVVTNVVWEMNIFTFAVELSKEFEKKEPVEIVLPTSENDPYGIIAKCEESGIYTETPYYLPEGFKLTTIGYDTGNAERKYIAFIYENGKQLINLTFESYMDGLLGIPSDEHNISEIEISGHTAIVSKEDNQMIAIFRTGDFYVTVCSRNVDYSECDKIIESIK